VTKQTFIVTITTDGLDGPDDMKDIASQIESALPKIVMPFVHEVEPAVVKWVKPAKSRKAKSKKR
jgi:hypothetical protein